MKVKIDQLIRFATQLGDKPLRTIGGKKTFTVQPSGSGLKFFPEGKPGRPVSKNALREVLGIYNKNPEDLSTRTYRNFYHASYLLAILRDLTGSHFEFDSPPRLSSKGQRLLTIIYGRIHRKEVLADRPDTYPSYTSLLRELGLPTKPQPGRMLQNNGLDELDYWSIDLELPPITGLIIEETTDRPSGGFEGSHPTPPGRDREEWWKEEMRRVITYNWTKHIVALDEVSVDVQTIPEGQASERAIIQVARIIRNTVIIQDIKSLYEGLCQRCGVPVQLPGRLYVEGHHLWPLSIGGFDEKGNVICVCPTCHVLLDYAAVPFSTAELKCVRHTISQKNIDHHNERYAKNKAKLP